MKERKIAIIILVLLAGLYLAGLGGGMFFSDQPGKSREAIEEKLANDEFEPSKEFPIMAKIGELTSYLASGIKPGEGLIPKAQECKLADGSVILTQTQPRCTLTINGKTVKIGPGKKDIEQVVMKVIARIHARVYQVNHDSKTLDKEIYGLCKLPENYRSTTPTLFVIYKQKRGKPDCERQKDPSKPVIVAIDNYSPLTLICRGCTDLPSGQLEITFK